MLSPEEAKELAAIYQRVEDQLLALLQDRAWHMLREARERIPHALAEAAYRLSGSWINDQHPDRLAAIRGTYSWLLAREAAHSLVRQGVCEIKHDENEEDAVRRTRKPKAGTRPTGRAGPGAATPTSAKRPRQTETPEPVGPAAAPRVKPTGTSAQGCPARHSVAGVEGTEPSGARLYEDEEEEPFAILNKLEAEVTQAAARPHPRRPIGRRTPRSKARKKK